MERVSPRFHAKDDSIHGKEVPIETLRLQQPTFESGSPSSARRSYHLTSVQDANSPNGTVDFSTEGRSGSAVRGIESRRRNRMTPEMMVVSSSDDED